MRTLLLFTILCLVSSCKKEEPVVPTPSFIVLGEQDGMNVTTNFEAIGGDFYTEKHIDIDLNQDGLYDLRIIEGPSLNPDAGLIIEGRIQSLHESCKMNISQHWDTTFVTTSFQSNVDQNGDPIGIQATTYSCRRETEFYNVDTVAFVTDIDRKNPQDLLSINDPFLGGSFVLNPANSTSFEPNGIVSQGVTFYDLINYYNDCKHYTGEEKLIGVKLYTSEGVKLGWVRLQVSVLGRVGVYEWAIQN